MSKPRDIAREALRHIKASNLLSGSDQTAQTIAIEALQRIASAPEREERDALVVGVRKLRGTVSQHLSVLSRPTGVAKRAFREVHEDGQAEVFLVVRNHLDTLLARVEEDQS